MHDPAALRVVAAVPQTLLPGLGEQLAGVRYELPGVPGHSGQRLPTQSQLLPTIDPASHTAQIRLTLPAGTTGIAPGMFARVWLPSAASIAPGTDDKLYLPSSAILRRGEMSGVYVLDAQSRVLLRQVRLGRAVGERIEILSGVSKGEKVLADPKTANPR
jgi:membrane fusion protein, multidrug efflux system